MSRKDNLDQFDDLVNELQRTEERPYLPRPFKNELRSNLLNQYDKPTFSLANLGRLAGTAVAFTVLAFIVIYPWSSMSPSGATGAPVEVTRPVQPTPAPTIVPVEPELAASSFRDGPLLNRHALSATQVNPGDTLDVTLFWEGEIAPNAQVALHLTDASSVLFSQADQPLTTEMTLSLPIPETLTDGVYEIVVVRYDAATGVRQDSFLLQEIGVGTAVTAPEHAPNDVWLIAATQKARNSADDPITLEITVGYELVTAEDAILSLSFIHPEWETHASLDEIRYPNPNALGEQYPIQAGIGSVTITATVEPETITSAINSDEFGLMSRLWATDENGRLIFGPILMGFDKDMTFNVQSVEEITYP